jgi:hypothetical protein
VTPRYDATEAVFTSDVSRATLFCDHDVARAVLSVFTSKKVALRTCNTRVLKGVRVAVGLPPQSMTQHERTLLNRSATANVRLTACG